MQFDELRKDFAKTLAKAVPPSDQSLEEQLRFFKFLVIKIHEYKQVLDKKMDLVLQYLMCEPDTPVCLYGIMQDGDALPCLTFCLYGIMPDGDALPNFFPTLFPYMQEPWDVEEYVEISDKIKAWQAVFANSCTFMEQLFDSLQDDACKGTWTEDSLQECLNNIRATYDQWSLHQKKLMGHCNDLLQLSIVASRIPAKPKKFTLTVERDIAEQLEARIYHNQKLNDGWLATADIAWN